MTVKIWNGATAAIYTPGDWSPVGMPVAGDVGIVSHGAVLANGLTLDGFSMHLAGNGLGVPPTLELTGTTLGALFRLNAEYGGSNGATPTAQIDVNGIDNNAGQIFAGHVHGHSAATLQIQLGSPNDELINTGVIAAEPGSTISITNGLMENNGELAVKGGNLILNTQTTGTGTILIQNKGGYGGTVTVNQMVGSGQQVLMHGGTLALGMPSDFLATLHGWNSNSVLDLLNTHLTSIDVNHGSLMLHDGNFTEGVIKLAGQYTTSDFHFINDTTGGSIIFTTHVGPLG